MTFQTAKNIDDVVEAAGKKLNALGNLVLRRAFQEVASPAVAFVKQEQERGYDAILGAMRVNMDRVFDGDFNNVAGYLQRSNDLSEIKVSIKGILKSAAEEFVGGYTHSSDAFKANSDDHRICQEYILCVAEKLAQHDAFRAGPK